MPGSPNATVAMENLQEAHCARLSPHSLEKLAKSLSHFPVEHRQISLAKILVHTSKFYIARSPLPQIFDNHDTSPQN